jgi:hypothetical protein
MECGSFWQDWVIELAKHSPWAVLCWYLITQLIKLHNRTLETLIAIKTLIKQEGQTGSG